MFAALVRHYWVASLFSYAKSIKWYDTILRNPSWLQHLTHLTHDCKEDIATANHATSLAENRSPASEPPTDWLEPSAPVTQLGLTQATPPRVNVARDGATFTVLLVNGHPFCIVKWCSVTVLPILLRKARPGNVNSNTLPAVIYTYIFLLNALRIFTTNGKSYFVINNKPLLILYAVKTYMTSHLKHHRKYWCRLENNSKYCFEWPPAWRLGTAAARPPLQPMGEPELYQISCSKNYVYAQSLP